MVYLIDFNIFVNQVVIGHMFEPDRLVIEKPHN